MADEADVAQATEEMALADSLARIVKIDPNAVSAEECDECLVEIPLARRKAMPGCRLCVDCQGMNEQRNRR